MADTITTADHNNDLAAGGTEASLYCALMLDVELDLLGSEGELIIEGAWLRNPLLCGILAQLRPQQTVYLSCDETGTVSGAAQLAFGVSVTPAVERVCATTLQGLADYRSAWLDGVC